MKMMKTAIALAALLGAGACVSIDVEDNSPAADRDATLSALMRATPEECASDAANAQTRSSGPADAVGLTEELMGVAALSGASSGQALRMRRIIIAPGGVIPWLTHDGRQGMGMIVSGEMVEYSNQCQSPLRRGPGSISREVAGLAHYWRNESDTPAVLIATDVVPE